MAKSQAKKIFFITIIIVAAIIIVNLFFIGIATHYNDQTNDVKTSLFLKSKKFTYYDNILIKNPYNNRKKTIRCVGYPNDKILIDNGITYINDKIEPKNQHIYHKYRINCFTPEANNKLKNKYKLIDSVNTLGVYTIEINNNLLNTLKQDTLFLLKKIICEKEYGNKEIFPYSFKYRWNQDNFGPVKIPGKGMKIDLNERNYTLYKHIIEHFEKNTIIFDGNHFTLNGTNIHKYTFQKNYFFVLNDHRNNYEDSRKWGFIPEEYILGTVFYSF